MKKICLLLILFVSIPAFSQSINDYQYVIVPIKFDFLKENDKFRLNTLTKLLLQKYTFKSYLSTEEIPVEIENQRCNLLYASISEDNNFLLTKIKVVLKDCKDKVVYETEFGTSRAKEYATAYNEALRSAFKSFDKLNYKYNGKSDVQVEELKSTENTVPIMQQNGIEIGESNLISSNALVAETIENGFLVIDSTTSIIVLKLFKTSNESIFIATSKTINGVVIKKGKDSFLEYYESGKLVSEKLNVCCI